MQTTELFSSIASTVPSLSSWAKEMSIDPEMEMGETVVHLHAELLARCQNGRIEELRSIASIIERLLEENDEQDQVTMGLIEPLVWEALDGNLDAAATREALGSRAQSRWDEFYLGARRNDLRAVQFEKRDLGPAATTPAKLAEWLIRPNRWVDSGATVARLAVNSGPAELRVRTRCWIDRFAVPAGHSLAVGDLLLYVAPEAPGTPKDEPLCTLVAAPAA